jgi:hypothetical protein
VTGCCEHANELSVSIKSWEFLEQLRNYQLLKDSAPSYSTCVMTLSNVVPVTNTTSIFKDDEKLVTPADITVS